MKTNFFDTQNVLSDDLNDLQAFLASQSIKIQQAALGNSGGFGKSITYMSGSVVKGGIYGSPSNYRSNQNFRAFKSLSNVIIVNSGVALDSLGNLIICTAGFTILAGSSSSTYIWTVSPSTQNYIKLSYKEVAGSYKIDDYGVSKPTRYTDSFYVTINSTLPTSSEILLGTFTADSSGYVVDTEIIDRRLYVRTLTTADAVSLDPITVPVASWTSVEDHILAKGSGTPSSTNPHGITFGDIEGLNAETHIKLSHYNGIIFDDLNSAAAKDSWRAYVTSGLPTTVQFTAPYKATASIAGKLFTSALSSYTIPGSTPNGTYYVVTDSTGSISLKDYSDTSLDLRDSQYLKICAIQVTGVEGYRLPALYNNPLNLDEIDGDCRKVFSTSQNQVQFDSTESYSNPSVALSTDSRFYSLEDNLNRIRWQLGKAISNNPGNWKSSTFPLTAGLTSNADAYHTHSALHSKYLYLNNGRSDGFDASLRVYTGASSYASIEFPTLTTQWEFYSSVIGSTKTLSSIKAASLVLGTYTLSSANLNTLTAGVSSVADSLHTHLNFSPLINVGGVSLSSASVSNLNILTSGSTGSVSIDSLHAHDVRYYTQSQVDALIESVGTRLISGIVGTSSVYIGDGWDSVPGFASYTAPTNFKWDYAQFIDLSDPAYTYYGSLSDEDVTGAHTFAVTKPLIKAPSKGIYKFEVNFTANISFINSGNVDLRLHKYTYDGTVHDEIIAVNEIKPINPKDGNTFDISLNFFMNVELDESTNSGLYTRYALSYYSINSFATLPTLKLYIERIQPLT